MWSNKYHYLNIYYDEQLSVDRNTQEIVAFITGIPQLMQTGDFEFQNKEPFPFTHIQLLKARNLQSWNEKDTHFEKTNLIHIICTKASTMDFEEMKKVFIQIASFLAWSLTEEESENGVENHVLWKYD